MIPTPGQRRMVGHPASLAGPASSQLTQYLKIGSQLIIRIPPGRGRDLIGTTIGQPHLLADVLAYIDPTEPQGQQTPTTI
jgi:hypothetical protein